MLRVVTAFAIALAIAAATALASTDEVLVDAFERGDAVAMKRAAGSSSARSLSILIEAGVRRPLLAAALAAPHAPDAPLLLSDLARCAHSADRSIALTCARAGIAIVSAASRYRLAELEVPRTDLADALRRWHSLARDDERWADVRVLALEISAALATELADKPEAAIIELAGDSDPEVRSAAFELLPSPLPRANAERVGRAVALDADRQVAVTAAASLCAGLAFGDPLDVAAALRADGRERLESLVLDKALSPVLRLDAAHCLRAVGGETTLAKLAKTMPASLAARAKELAANAP